MNLPILRYAVVGVASNAIGYSAYLALTWLGVPFKLAMSFLYALAICISFLSNRNWVFKYRGDLPRAVWRFGLAHAAGYLFNLGLLVFFVDKLGYPHEWVQAATIFVVGAFLFVVFRLFVFRQYQAERSQV